MKEKILEAIKNFGGNVIGSGEFFALADFIHSQIADGLGKSTTGSETGKHQLSDVMGKDRSGATDGKPGGIHG